LGEVCLVISIGVKFWHVSSPCLLRQGVMPKSGVPADGRARGVHVASTGARLVSAPVCVNEPKGPKTAAACGPNGLIRMA
jgi:hypothetical protein